MRISILYGEDVPKCLMSEGRKYQVIRSFCEDRRSVTEWMNEGIGEGNFRTNEEGTMK